MASERITAHHVSVAIALRIMTSTRATSAMPYGGFTGSVNFTD